VKVSGAFYIKLTVLEQRFSTQTTPQPIFLKEKNSRPAIEELQKVVIIHKPFSRLVLRAKGN